jgi:hypothetical protein
MPPEVDPDLLRIAVRVLSAHIHQRDPDPADVEFLRSSVRPAEPGLPIDELACLIVEQEIAKRNGGSQ